MEDEEETEKVSEEEAIRKYKNKRKKEEEYAKGYKRKEGMLGKG